MNRKMKKTTLIYIFLRKNTWKIECVQENIESLAKWSNLYVYVYGEKIDEENSL